MANLTATVTGAYPAPAESAVSVSEVNRLRRELLIAICLLNASCPIPENPHLSVRTYALYRANWLARNTLESTRPVK